MDEKEIREQTQRLRQRLFLMRNGMVGDQMRRGGVDYKVNFGLNLPQMVEIAADFPQDKDFAESLWNIKTTRECMICAIMLYPRHEMTARRAQQWIAEAPTTEVVDILCHRLLRHLDFAHDLPAILLSDAAENPLVHYAGLRLIMNLLNRDSIARFKPLVEREVASGGPTARFAAGIIDEMDF